jgi:hypothetical protein
VRENDHTSTRRANFHRRRHWSKMGMERDDQLGLPERSTQGIGKETGLGATESCERNLLGTESEGRCVWRVVQTQQATLVTAANCERHKNPRSQAAGALHAAGGRQLRKQPDDHAGSLRIRRSVAETKTIGRLTSQSLQSP